MLDVLVAFPYALKKTNVESDLLRALTGALDSNDQSAFVLRDVEVLARLFWGSTQKINIAPRISLDAHVA